MNLIIIHLYIKRNVTVASCLAVAGLTKKGVCGVALCNVRAKVISVEVR